MCSIGICTYETICINKMTIVYENCNLYNCCADKKHSAVKRINILDVCVLTKMWQCVINFSAFNKRDNLSDGRISIKWEYSNNVWL